MSVDDEARNFETPFEDSSIEIDLSKQLMMVTAQRGSPS